MTMSKVIPARTWSSHALALTVREMYKILAQQASEAGRQRTTSLAVYLEMIDTEVGHVMATNRVLAWAKRCWNKKNEEGMHRVWKFTRAMNISWTSAEAPAAPSDCSWKTLV